MKDLFFRNNIHTALPFFLRRAFFALRSLRLIFRRCFREITTSERPNALVDLHCGFVQFHNKSTLELPSNTPKNSKLAIVLQLVQKRGAVMIFSGSPFTALAIVMAISFLAAKEKL